MSSNAWEHKANIFKGQDCSLLKIMYFYGGYFTLKQNWALNLSAKVFSKNVLIGDTILTSPTTDRGLPFYKVIRTTRRSSRLQCIRNTFINFLSYFKSLSIGPAQRIEPATFRSAVKRSIDWANFAAVQMNCFNLLWDTSLMSI